MSSLEIADRTGKSHDNVLRDIRGMLTELHGDALRFEAIYRDSMNRKKPCFELPKHETLVLVTGYSIPMRAAVVARWQELEAQVAAPAIPNFSDPAAAARAWANEYEGRRAQEALRIAAQAEVEALKPAAAVSIFTNPQTNHQDNVA